MSPDTPQPDDLTNEELTAYLDGELPDADSRQIERRLADDETLRARLHELQQTWEMLDALPKANMTDAFTTSTLSMVALAAEKDIQADHRNWQRLKGAWWILGGGLALAAAGAGFWLTQSQLSQPNRELARDLPVIERLDQYRYVDNLEFLQRLDHEGLFVSEESDAP